ncbi:MAG: hypothetical protein Q9181_007263 [Wetmoreana brouardii]
MQVVGAGIPERKQRGVEDEAQLADRNYIRCDTEGVEKIPENEEEDIKRHRQEQAHRPRRPAGPPRAEHVQPPRRIPPHLPLQLEPSDPGLDDRIAQPRRFAMKVFNIQGDFLPSGVGISTLDTEFNSTPALNLADANTTRDMIGLSN